MNIKKTPLVIALYLPQFYETEYNNKWWEKGYTEWVACKKAKPLFKGHYQPRVPLNKNYYDLSKVECIREQMQMASRYGIDGFAIYQYYSCGKKLLEIPTEIIRDDNSLDFPFFLYWANESWRKSWFGQNNQIVWKQEYGVHEDWRNHFLYCLDYFKKKNYIKIEGKPVYAIYNPWDVPNVEDFIDKWDAWAREEGFPGIYFVKTLTRRDSLEKGKFSAVITREPNYTFAHDEKLIEKLYRVLKTRFLTLLNRYILMPFGRGVPIYKIKYEKIWNKIITRKVAPGATILGAFCDFDTSPRKSYNSIIIQGASPHKFGYFFSSLVKKARKVNSPMIVINAWNEWAEGAYLEPDDKFEDGYLRKILETKEADD